MLQRDGLQEMPVLYLRSIHTLDKGAELGLRIEAVGLDFSGPTLPDAHG
jgi:hypothetical protein